MSNPSNLPPIQSQPFDTREFRHALGCFATGVTIVTAQAPDGRRAGLTCNSFAAVSLNPPLVLWSLVVHSPSMSIFQEASHFTVNVLGESQIELAATFARHAEDKFLGLAFEPGLGDAPVLPGCAAHFECRNAHRYYGGDHVIFMGIVETFTYCPAKPLIFARGEFGSFAPAI
jgi:flavin reductase (DIM6/NTAB) family NADH-FMN oxidoreductase RutF